MGKYWDIIPQSFSEAVVRFCSHVRKTAKATISFVMSVCPSAFNNSASTRRIFIKFDFRAFF
jgi:hypothetical protein